MSDVGFSLKMVVILWSWGIDIRVKIGLVVVFRNLFFIGFIVGFLLI